MDRLKVKRTLQGNALEAPLVHFSLDTWAVTLYLLEGAG